MQAEGYQLVVSMVSVSSCTWETVADLYFAKQEGCALKTLLPKILGSSITDTVLLLPVTARVEG